MNFIFTSPRISNLFMAAEFQVFVICLKNNVYILECGYNLKFKKLKSF